ncbi:zinc finger MYND domain-containing protein 19 [Eurytemora carolleeae]|uniref:zinc finger MYND domain-containing protein 19 n=1 Tax=Eurytemora carolleeae TaxID=1294199 RepID=UPI000C77AC71|nr:zinc finger MYND domain-containing protein 19 [Eurytemora carolleeae]|eukprot:XP_023349160.1 zinc finger MYND domain-containing protein 19-like [Eurytemora affinis]
MRLGDDFDWLGVGLETILQIRWIRRLENLILVPLAIGDRWCSHPNHSFSTKPGAPGFDIEGSLYWAAILQLPYDPLDEYAESVVVRTCNQDGVITEEEDDSQCYYECRFGPCIAVEKDLREFSICGRCQEARYCGAACQQRDWSNHKRICREKRRAFPLIFTEAEPDR